MKERLDVIGYVFLLSLLFVKGNLERLERLEHPLDIHLQTASYA
jgi:hypothetical protein